MRAVRVSTSGVSVSAPVPIDKYLNPCSIAIGCIVTGTATYKVQHTFDDVFASGFDPDTATWFDHPTITGKTANFDGNYAFPPTAVRLNQTVGDGSVVMVVNQAGAVG